MHASEDKSFYAEDRKSWRKWLEKNHAVQENIWLIIYHKKSNKPTLSIDEIVEEALCFGWIDSKANKRDPESFYLLLAKRKPKGVWSKLNKQRVKKLTKLGLIMPSGRKMIDLAKKTGTWNALNEVENLVVPDDLKKAFSKNKTALKHFEAFPPSSRKIILGWINSAKQDATRKKRIEETVILAAKNLRANHYRQK